MNAAAAAARPVALTALLALGLADLVFINTSLVPRLLRAPIRIDVEVAGFPSPGSRPSPPVAAPAAARAAAGGGESEGEGEGEDGDPAPLAAGAPGPPAVAPATAAPSAGVAPAVPPPAVAILEGTGFKVPVAAGEGEPGARALPVTPMVATAFFPTGQARLDREARAAVDRIIPIAQADPASVIVIEGHADSRGEARYNDRLSKRRAQAVARQFTGAGVVARRLVIRAHGARRPADTSASEQALRRNRRVEIVVGNGEGGPR